MGLRLGLRREALGALTLAMDEALVLVLPTTNDGVDITFAATGGDDTPAGLTVTVGPRNATRPPDPAACDRLGEILSGIVNDLDVDPTSGLVRLVIDGVNRSG